MPKKKSTKRKKKSGVGAKKTRTFGGKRYTLKTCSRKKTDAKKKAKRHREKSKRAAARVVDTGGKYCVYTRG